MTRTLSPLEKGHVPSSTADTVPYHQRVNEIPGPTPRSNSKHGGELTGVYRDKLIITARYTIDTMAAQGHPKELLNTLTKVIDEYEDRTAPTL